MTSARRWLNEKHLGRLPTSKAIVPAQVGEVRGAPDEAFLVLRAWMLHRWQGNGGQFLEKTSRLLAWGREVDELKKDIRRRGGKVALHAKTRELIFLWAPLVLED